MAASWLTSSALPKIGETFAMTLRLAVVAMSAVAGVSLAAAADEFKLGSLEIVQPWARATIGQAANGIAFMTIENHGSNPDRLIGVTSPVAAKVELHEHKMENGVMEMRQLDEVDLNPGDTVVLRPGGLHVMLVGINKKLAEHDKFPMTLTFMKAGSVEIEVNVESVGASGPTN